MIQEYIKHNLLEHAIQASVEVLAEAVDLNNTFDVIHSSFMFRNITIDRYLWQLPDSKFGVLELGIVPNTEYATAKLAITEISFKDVYALNAKYDRDKLYEIVSINRHDYGPKMINTAVKLILAYAKSFNIHKFAIAGNDDHNTKIEQDIKNRYYRMIAKSIGATVHQDITDSKVKHTLTAGHSTAQYQEFILP